MENMSFTFILFVRYAQKVSSERQLWLAAHASGFSLLAHTGAEVGSGRPLPDAFKTTLQRARPQLGPAETGHNRSTYVGACLHRVCLQKIPDNLLDN